MRAWILVGGFNPLKNISQLGLLFPIYGKIKHVPNHQPKYIDTLLIHTHSDWNTWPGRLAERGIMTNQMTGWWLTYHSEKWWTSSVGMIIPFPMNMESRKVPWFQTTNQMINSGDLSKKWDSHRANLLQPGSGNRFNHRLLTRAPSGWFSPTPKNAKGLRVLGLVGVDFWIFFAKIYLVLHFCKFPPASMLNRLNPKPTGVRWI